MTTPQEHKHTYCGGVVGNNKGHCTGLWNIPCCSKAHQDGGSCPEGGTEGQTTKEPLGYNLVASPQLNQYIPTLIPKEDNRECSHCGIVKMFWSGTVCTSSGGHAIIVPAPPHPTKPTWEEEFDYKVESCAWFWDKESQEVEEEQAEQVKAFIKQTISQREKEVVTEEKERVAGLLFDLAAAGEVSYTDSAYRRIVSLTPPKE